MSELVDALLGWGIFNLLLALIFLLRGITLAALSVAGPAAAAESEEAGKDTPPTRAEAAAQP